MNSNPGNPGNGENNEGALSSEVRSLLEQLKPFRTVPLTVSVELGRGKLKLRDLLDLKYHSVFALDQNAGAKLNIYANGIPLAKGEPVITDNQVGIKIDEVLDSHR
jgi:flagellar motor switch protein FliN/FliY